MELSTRSRQRQQKMKEKSERTSRSLLRQEKAEYFELGLRRSLRGKVESTGQHRISKSRVQDEKKSEKILNESSSDSLNIGSRKKAVKKTEQVKENDKIEQTKSQDETSKRTEAENTNSDSNCLEDNIKQQAKNEAEENSFRDEDKAGDNQLTRQDCGVMEHSQPSEINIELATSDNPACDSRSDITRSDNNDYGEDYVEETDKFQPAKRRKRGKRFITKKRETKTCEKISMLAKIQGISGDSKDEDSEHSDKDGEPKSKRNRLGLSMVSKLQTSKGFVDKVKFGLKPEEIIPMKRTPRMASLNAIAKVNAVLESYSPLAGKAMNKIKENVQTKKFDTESKSKTDKQRKRSTSSVTQTDDIIYFPPLRQAKDDWMVSNATSNDVFSVVSSSFDDQPISDSKVSSTSNYLSDDEGTITTKDKAVQTVVNHKAVQTDSYLMHDRASEVSLGNPSNCTCNYAENASNESPVTTYYKIPPTVSSNTLNVPLHSSILTKTTTHSIAIPFTKNHVLSHMDMSNLENFPSQVSNMQTNKRMASLNAIAMMNAMKVLDRPFLSLTNLTTGSARRREFDKLEKNGSGHIRIPKINFQATSTSKFGGSNKGKVVNPSKSAHLKSLSSQIEKLMETKKSEPRHSNKMVNGWLFEGEPVEKPVVYDDKVVIRRYYTSMRRNAEVINVRDAVLLKSGPRKKDLPFVARVAAIWEEDEGYSSGDMMISVFWYYRPEQTEVGKIPGYNGDLEVLASRHRDDNSAACVVDKCYVLSYPQYCRFRARNKLFRESRKIPLSPVPPSESTRPGLMPPANIDPNLVFFCRHAYDSRTGKIIKNPFY